MMPILPAIRALGMSSTVRTLSRSAARPATIESQTSMSWIVCS